MRKATDELVYLRGIAWQEGLNTLAAEERVEQLRAVLTDALTTLKMVEMYVRIDGLAEEVRQVRACIELLESQQ